jgi:hypothetical protein
MRQYVIQGSCSARARQVVRQVPQATGYYGEVRASSATCPWKVHYTAEVCSRYVAALYRGVAPARFKLFGSGRQYAATAPAGALPKRIANDQRSDGVSRANEELEFTRLAIRRRDLNFLTEGAPIRAQNSNPEPPRLNCGFSLRRHAKTIEAHLS